MEWIITIVAIVIACLFGALLVDLACFIDDIIWRVRNERQK